MSTKSPVDLRAELAELVKRKAEIAVSTHVEINFYMHTNIIVLNFTTCLHVCL